MSLKDWQKNGWLRSHKTSAKEISDLFKIIDRDTRAAQTANLDTDWKFGIAYNAALKLCTILLYAEGYRPENAQAHYRTITALPKILGDHRKTDAEYLNSCRSTRNVVEYQHVGGTSDQDVSELVQFAIELKTEVVAWLRKNHPVLLD